MQQSFNAFLRKFQIERLTVMSVGSWVVSVRPEQVTVGSLVLSLARPCSAFGQLTRAEGADLAAAFRAIEKLCAASFRPDRINYLALMMVDSQVHFHVIPRYTRAIVLGGLSFVDRDWPKPPGLQVVEMPARGLDLIQRRFAKAVQACKATCPLAESVDRPRTRRRPLA